MIVTQFEFLQTIILPLSFAKEPSCDDAQYAGNGRYLLYAKYCYR